MKKFLILVVSATTLSLLGTILPASASTGVISSIRKWDKLQAGGVDVVAQTTVTCDAGTTATLYGQFSQSINGKIVSGANTWQFVCTGVSQSKTMRVFAYSTAFKVGTGNQHFEISGNDHNGVWFDVSRNMTVKVRS